jgi:hypothetical protein
MTFLSVAEQLAQDMASGTYRPTAVDSCESTFTLDRNPHLVRFVEFTLFTEAKPRHPLRPRVLVLQPQRLVDAGTASNLETFLRRQVVGPLIKEWEVELPTRELPAPSRGATNEIREAIRGLASGSLHLSGGRGASLDLGVLPRLDLPDGQLRARYSDWLQMVTDEASGNVLNRFRPSWVRTSNSRP